MPKAFTICSNNYLSEALTLGCSLVVNGFPSEDFIIFIVDKRSTEIDYDMLEFEVVEITEEIVAGFNCIVDSFTIVELNTSVKPSVFKFLHKIYPKEKIIAYFDPDLYFYRYPFDILLGELGDNSILLTPHVTKPIDIGSAPFENVFLNHGLYNLGFIVISVDENSLSMLDWWEERTLTLGVDDVSNGLFVDQLWMNLVPIFFEKVRITKNPGYNVAYWNIRERDIVKCDDKYYVNGVFDLLFMHYSSFDMSLKYLSTRKHSNAEPLKADLIEMMHRYKDELIRNRYYFYRKIKPAYSLKIHDYVARSIAGEQDGKLLRTISLLYSLKRESVTTMLRRIEAIIKVMGKYYKYAK